MKKAKKWSGRQLLMPFKYQKNTTTTSWSGFDTLSTSATDNKVNLTFDPGFTVVSSVLPQDELAVNQNSSDSEAILDLVALTLQSDAEDLADSVGTQMYADGTGNGGKDLQGLGNIVDDGTVAATYGGQSRSTYSGLNATVTASSGTLTLAKMATLANNITSDPIRPTAGFTTEAVFSLYEQLLVSNERYIVDQSERKNGVFLGTGSNELAFRGFPVLRDEKCTSQALFFLNENFLFWYGIELPGAEPIKYKDSQIVGNGYSGRELISMGFNWSNWIKPYNQMSFVGFTTLNGQLVCNAPKRQGKLTGITSV